MTNDCRALVLAAVCLPVAFSGHVMYCGAVEKTAKEVPFTLSVRLAEKRDRWFVGDKLCVIATLKNVSTHEIAIRDWTSENVLHGSWSAGLGFKDFPGKLQRRLEFEERTYFCDARGKRLQLKPGEVSKPFEREFKLPLPGEAEVWVMFGLALDECLPVKVAPEMSAAMAARYAAAREKIFKGDGGGSAACDTLKEVAGEQNYFAARFVHEVWTKAAPGPTKTAALRHLVDLLDVGIAYEYVPDLLGVLRDESSPKEIRKGLLDRLGKMHLKEDCAGIPVANVGFYNLPDTVRESAIETVRAVERGTDPDLAARAKAILERPKPASK